MNNGFVIKVDHGHTKRKNAIEKEVSDLINKTFEKKKASLLKIPV